MVDKEVRDVVIVDILPANLDAEIQKAVQGRKAMDKIFNELLQQGVDFDRVPGTDKPTLLKPGAELLCQVFRLAPGKPEMLNFIEDFERGIFSYTVSLPIIHRETGMLVATGIGSANSQEVKYKYRKEEKDGEKVRTLNPEPADQQNTLVKMAAKRAFVDGILKATGASRMFTQDIEDMPWLKVEAEKPSSKQLGYAKSFYKNVSDDDVMADISQILSREVTGWDDITRDEASAVIDANLQRKKQAQQQPIQQQPVQNGTGTAKAKLVCSRCQKQITKAVAEYSQKHFGQHLCQPCQKQVKEEQTQFESVNDIPFPWEEVDEQ